MGAKGRATETPDPFYTNFYTNAVASAKDGRKNATLVSALGSLRGFYLCSCSESRPSSTAHTAAWVRSETPSLSMMRLT